MEVKLEEIDSYVCPCCGKVYSEQTVAAYEIHVKKCGLVDVRCDVCGKKFLSLEAMKFHMKLYHTDCALFACETCGKEFRLKYCLQQHEKTHLDSSERQRVTCHLCDKTFAFKGSLRRHLNNHFTPGTACYACPCGKTFFKYTTCYYHKKRCPMAANNTQSEIKLEAREIVDEETDDIQSSHKCQYCGVGFSDRQELSEHVDTCDPFLEKRKLLTREEADKLLSKYKVLKPNKQGLLVGGPIIEGDEVENNMHNINNTEENGADGKIANVAFSPDAFVSKSNFDTKASELLATIAIKIKAEHGKKQPSSKEDLTVENLRKDNQEMSAKSTDKCTLDQGVQTDQIELGRSKRKRKLKQFNDYETDFSEKNHEACITTISKAGNDKSLAPVIKQKKSSSAQKGVHEKTNNETSDKSMALVSILKNIKKESDACNKVEKEALDEDEIKNKSGEKSLVYVCTTNNCFKTFADEQQLVTHKKEVHNQNLESWCSECNKVFATSSGYNLHVKMVHKTRPADKTQKTTDKPGITKRESCATCVTCGHTFESSDELLDHISKEHALPPYCCGVCKQIFNRMAALKKHLLCHNNPALVCRLCCHAFLNEEMLKEHRRSHYRAATAPSKVVVKRFSPFKKPEKKVLEGSSKTKPPEKSSPKDKKNHESKESLAANGGEIDCANPQALVDGTKVNDKSADTAEIIDSGINSHSVARSNASSGNVHLTDSDNEEDVQTSHEADDIADDGETAKARKPRKKKKTNSYSAGYYPHTPGLTYICETDNCNEPFPVKLKLIEHKKKVHKERLDILCTECNKTFTAMNVFKTHMRMRHLGEVGTIPLAYKNVSLRHSGELSRNYEIPVCVKCAARLTNEDVAQHTCSNTVQLQFFCPYCKGKATSFNKIQDHMKDQHPKMTREVKLGAKYQHLRNDAIDEVLLVEDSSTDCIRCTMKFDSNDELRSHISTEHANMPFCCGVCKSGYGRMSALQKHLTQHNMAFVCDVCSKSCYDQRSLDLHQNIHTGERPFQCDVCGKRYCLSNSVKKHLKINHPEIFKQRYGDAVSSQQHDAKSEGCICPVCGRIFQTPRRLNIHIKSHKKGATLQCLDCLKFFENSHQLQRHKLKHKLCKLALKRNEMCLQKVSIPSTGELRLNYSDLKIVNEAHPSGKPYQCKVCLKRFKKGKLLSQHIHCMHFEENKKKYVCHVCGRGFARREMLDTHHRTHTSARPYRCRLCQKSYRQLAHIREHLRAHGKDLFSCKLCSLTFNTLAKLSHHLKGHCNVFPFVCPVESCNEKFRDISKLCEHGSTCFTDKDKASSFLCKICNQTFTQSDDVIMHLYVHESEGMFPCEVCGEQLTSFKYLYFHKEKLGHFLEADLQAQEKKYKFSIKSERKLCEASGDYDIEELMNQYDIIKESSLEPSEIDTVERVQESNVVEMDYGNQAEDLILIAEQLTNMAAAAEHYSVVSDQEDTVQQLHEFNADVLELNSTVASDTVSYPAVVAKTATVGSDTDLFTGKSQRDNQDGDLLRESKESLDDTDVNVPVATEHLDIQSEQISSELGLQLTDGGYKYVVVNDTDKNTKVDQLANEDRSVQQSNLNEDVHVDIAKEVNENVNIILEHLKFNNIDTGLNFDNNLKVVDTQGNEMTVCIINENGEQEQLTDSQEILRSVIQTGKYKVQYSYKQIDATADSLEGGVSPGGTSESIINGAESSNKVQITDVVVVSEKDENENAMTVVNTDVVKTQTQPMLGTGRKNLQKKGGNTKRLIRGEFVKSGHEVDEHDGLNFKARMRYYQEKNETTHPLVCDECGSRYRRIKDLNQHKKSHRPDEERAYRCTECGAGFNSNCSLKIHIRGHTGDKPCKCEICGKAFRQLGHLQVHRRSHLQYSPFRCTVCDKRFRTNSYLTRHMRKHNPEDEDTIKCQVCNTAFLHPHDLKLHQVKAHLSEESQKTLLNLCNATDINNEETEVEESNETRSFKERNQRLHICEVCGRTFKSAYSAKLHRDRHETGTSFKCPKCDKTFQTKSLQVSHTNNAHRTPRVCEVCGLQFTTKPSLNRHLLHVHKKGAYKYKCQRCGLLFNVSQFFLRHVSGCMKNDVNKILADNDVLI